MKGFAVQISETEFLNSQLLPVEKQYALAFTLRSDAELVASAYKGAGIVEVDIVDRVSGGRVGTYFEYHKDW